MLNLTSDYWTQLEHAYGYANDIPDLIGLLSDYPTSADSQSEPFFSLWSSLCHQGDTCTAAYAAVPHLLDLAMREPSSRISFDYLALPSAIEIARCNGRGPTVPEQLIESYKSAFKNVPQTIGQLNVNELDETWCIVCAGALAVAAGFPKIAEAITELNGDNVEAFLTWNSSR